MDVPSSKNNVANNLEHIFDPFKSFQETTCFNHREGLGLLEHQAMPSLRDVDHNGWLCMFTITQQLEFYQHAAGPLMSWQLWYGNNTEKAGGKARLSPTKSHLLGRQRPCVLEL